MGQNETRCNTRHAVKPRLPRTALSMKVAAERIKVGHYGKRNISLNTAA